MKHSIGITVTPNTLTEVFTVPAGFEAEVDMLFVSNHTSGSKWIDVYWEYGNDPTNKIYILFQKGLDSKNFLQFSNGSVVFLAGDSMNVKTENGSDYTLLVTFDLRPAAPKYNFRTT
jgi:hypothetical protein